MQYDKWISICLSHCGGKVSASDRLQWEVSAGCFPGQHDRLRGAGEVASQKVLDFDSYINCIISNRICLRCPTGLSALGLL